MEADRVVLAAVDHAHRLLYCALGLEHGPGLMARRESAVWKHLAIGESFAVARDAGPLRGRDDLESGLADQAGVAVHVETHRDRMTTDLFFTLQLLDCFPDLRLTADVSHYLVGREFAWPVDEVNHGLIRRILDNSWGIHGRIASREQVQISLGFPQHQGWVELFMGWWEYAIRSWRKRAKPDAVLTFLCELGPPPYAITGPGGLELSDRWEDALKMKDMVRALWQRIVDEEARGIEQRRAM